jgi:hypothetical protein
MLYSTISVSLKRSSFGARYRTRTFCLSMGFTVSAHGFVSLLLGWRMEITMVIWRGSGCKSCSTGALTRSSSIIRSQCFNVQALDVATGVSYLHNNDIIHGDLKGVSTTLTKDVRIITNAWTLGQYSHHQLGTSMSR